MALPKINTPTYELVIPSNGKKLISSISCQRRKILILALESEDTKQITTAVVDILSDCILTKNIDVTKLATFDIEYLFLNVRSKSVGESVDINITCPDDEKTSVEMSINIDSIKVQKVKGHKSIIKLDDQYSMKLKYPSMDQFIESNFESGQDGEEESDLDKSMSMITSCIDMIYDNEESWDAADSSQKELEEFIEQLNSKQFKLIENFLKQCQNFLTKLRLQIQKLRSNQRLYWRD